MHIFTPRLRRVTLFTTTYFVIFSAASIATQNYEFMLYEVQMALLFALLIFMDKRVTFSALVLWLMSIWGLAHLAGGITPIPSTIADMNDAISPDAPQVLYNMRLTDFLPRYDQIIHAYGFGTCTLLAREALSAHLGKKLPINWPIGAALVLIAMGLGTINEIIEFAVQLSLPQTNVGGYINTGWDLVSNTVGAIGAVLWMRWRDQSR
ncbi:MAG: hypothetical protein ACRBCT_04065 [Alphaproteobacteria bacterium]